MPASLSQVVSLIRDGTAAQVREALERGFAWPKDPARNPVFDLLDSARYTDAKQMPGKLEALLDHGLAVDFSLPFAASVVPSRRDVVRLGVIQDVHAATPNWGADLLQRAAALGLVDLIEVLLRRGAQDAQGLAKKAAAHERKLQALEKLLHETPTDFSQWGKWAEPLLCQRRSSGEQEAHALLSRHLPGAQDAPGIAAVLTTLRNQSLRGAVLDWLESDDSIWPRLHDMPGEAQKTGVVLSLWPHVLLTSSREDHPQLFKKAVDHMQTRQPAWIGLPVKALHAARWGQRTREDDYTRTGLMGWGGHGTPMPVLQTLLHGSRQLPKSKKQLRQMLRDAGSLMRAGCRLWVAGGEAGRPYTEQMLWALDHQQPNKKWLARHPQFLAAHSQTGETALHVVRDTKTADHWIECGLALDAVDSQVHQALARLVPLAGKIGANPGSRHISKGKEWATWIVEGWKHRNFPRQGQAWNATTAELACCHNKLFSAVPARIRNAMPKQGVALHWACTFGNPQIVEKLLSAGHDPAALDHAGRTPLLCLAMGTSAMWSEPEDAGFGRCVQMAITGQWPEGRDAQGIGPWQHLMQANRAGEYFDGNRNSSMTQLFEHLKQRRIKDPSLWQPADTTAALAHFQEAADVSRFASFIQGLPQVIVDDFLLALHDPDRWPQNMGRPVFAFAPKLVDALLACGADFEATSLTGQVLGDGIERLEARERSLEGTNLAHLLAKASLNQGPARAVMEQQRMARDVAPNAEPATGRRMRL